MNEHSIARARYLLRTPTELERIIRPAHRHIDAARKVLLDILADQRAEGGRIPPLDGRAESADDVADQHRTATPADGA